MTTVAVYPPEGTTYPDAAGVPITAAGAIVDVSKYILDALKRGNLLTTDPLETYEPDDRSDTPPGTGRVPLSASGLLYAADFGVVADGVDLSDCIVTAGSAILTSASASFTSSDVGKTIVVTTPSLPATGTVAGSSGGYFLNGTGTAFLSELGLDPGELGSGDAVYVSDNNQIYPVIAVYSDVLAQIGKPLTGTFSGKTIYREQHLEATIESIVSSTSIVMSEQATLSQTGVSAFYGTDNADALEEAIETADSYNAATLQLPPGIIAIERNCSVTGISNLTISGGHRSRACIKRLKRATFEIAYNDQNQGLLNFFNCSYLTLCDFSIDGLVPVMGMRRSEGVGSPDNNYGGGGIGIHLSSCAHSGFERIGTQGNGSRLECLYAQGVCPGLFFRSCFVRTSNIGINPNTTGGQVYGTIIEGNIVESPHGPLLCGLDSTTVVGNIFRNVDGCLQGADPVVLHSAADTVFTGNIIENFNTFSSTVSAINVFGGVDTTASVIISNNIIRNCHGNYSNGVVRFDNFAGAGTVSNNIITGMTTDGLANPFVKIDGAVTRSITIHSNTFDSPVSSEISVGVIGSSVPAGAVSLANNKLGPGVTTLSAGIS